MHVNTRSFGMALVLGAASLFSGGALWAGDDEDFCDPACDLGGVLSGNHLEKAEDAAGVVNDEVDSTFTNLLLSNDTLSSRLLYEWANAVLFVFDHFSLDDFSDDVWRRIFQGFDVSFMGPFREMLALLKASHEAAVQNRACTEYTHQEAGFACLLRYLERLIEEMQQTALHASDIAHEYVARPLPPVFNTYSARVAHFNAHPDERSANRHPFYLFMNEGYWLMRGWVNQYPALTREWHGLFRLVFAGVKLQWINKNQYDASGLARGQIKELLGAIVRILHRLNSYTPINDDLDADLIASLVGQFAVMFDQQVVQEREATDTGESVRLGLQTAIFAEFMVRVERFLNPTEAALAGEEDREAALVRVRDELNLEEEHLDSDEEEESINLAVYLEQLALLEEEEGRSYAPVERRNEEDLRRVRRTHTRRRHNGGGSEESGYLERLLARSGDDASAVEDDDDGEIRVRTTTETAAPIGGVVFPSPQRGGGALLPDIDPLGLPALRASVNFGGGCL